MDAVAGLLEQLDLNGLGSVAHFIIMAVCQTSDYHQNSGLGFSISCVAAPACTLDRNADCRVERVCRGRLTCWINRWGPVALLPTEYRELEHHSTRTVLCRGLTCRSGTNASRRSGDPDCGWEYLGSSTESTVGASAPLRWQETPPKRHVARRPQALGRLEPRRVQPKIWHVSVAHGLGKSPLRSSSCLP